MSEPFVIRFTAQVMKVQTTADHGIRVTFYLPETALDQAGILTEAARRGALVEVAAVPFEPEKQERIRDA